MCFSGKPVMIEVYQGRFSNLTLNFYNSDWKMLDISQGMQSSEKSVDKPKNLEKMLSFSSKLSENLPEARIDWYSVNNKLYFGEITFFDGAGLYEFKPEKWNKIFGDMIKLHGK